ncbi:hypothetical protein [Desulfovibrio gilichinskyi]|uniref:Uncharacterized protein n=1 Tax=Desulfovibrio gilichinskyi TaxID=1519643 RepID=A0A1X7F1S8_9BACT|nr:hypothetical protein [Desulfovibrio gilichinskyi]SMF44367.1 hypothetical protein SAMN06295933_3592 [Desulfovibrio gilichinskyi]
MISKENILENTLRQRKTNLNIANESYIKLQKKRPPPGKDLAELQFKIWGEYPCLHYFFKTQEGDKIRLASFRDENTGKYSRDLEIDFSEPGIEFNTYLACRNK